jgi:flagellar biosynthesis protein
VRRRPPSRTRAAALGYDRERDPAPRLLAKGDGIVADRIIAIAREHGIPIHEDRSLVETLSRLDIDEQIPVDLCLVVAELLAFLYHVDGLAGGDPDGG